MFSPLTPLSLQARRTRLSELKAALSSAIAEATTFLMTHDVEVSLTWFVTEEERYQSHTAADLDNVLKPLIDSAVGPSGVMVDDNQVQSIRAYWMTPGSLGSGFELEFQSLIPQDVVTRDGTAFVEFERDRCFILPGHPEAWPALVEGYRQLLAGQEELRSMGAADDVARGLNPVARPWHSQRVRLQGFKLFHHTHMFDESVGN